MDNSRCLRQYGYTSERKAIVGCVTAAVLLYPSASEAREHQLGTGIVISPTYKTDSGEGSPLHSALDLEYRFAGGQSVGGVIGARARIAYTADWGTEAALPAFVGIRLRPGGSVWFDATVALGPSALWRKRGTGTGFYSEPIRLELQFPIAPAIRGSISGGFLFSFHAFDPMLYVDSRGAEAGIFFGFGLAYVKETRVTRELGR